MKLNQFIISMSRLMAGMFICFLQSISFGQSIYPAFPSEDYISSTNQITFFWNNHQNLVDIQIADNEAFLSPISFLGIENDFFEFSIPSEGQYYYWRVKSSAGTNWSEARSFRYIDLTQISGIQFWLNANEGVTLNSNKVLSWTDMILNLTFSQSTATYQPSLGTINGQNTIRFGGVNGVTLNYLTSPISYNLNNNDYTVITAYHHLGLSTPLGYLLGGSTDGLFIGGNNSSGWRKFGLVDGSVINRATGSEDLNLSVKTLTPNDLYTNGLLESDLSVSIAEIVFNTVGTRPGATNLFAYANVGDIICFNRIVSDSIQEVVENYLKYKYTPFPYLGEDTTLCGQSVKLGFRTDHAYNSILWSTGATDVDSITVTNNGWYWVEAEAFDRVMRDSIFVSGLVPTPQLNVFNDTTICLYDTVELMNSFALPIDISTTWSTGSTDPTIEVADEDAYFLILSSPSGCEVSSDTITFTHNTFPQTEGLGADRTLCNNSSLFFELPDDGLSPFTYLWSTGQTTASILPSIPGANNYNVAVTDAMGCIAKDTVEINLVPIDGPTIVIDYDTLCPYEENTFVDLSVAATGDNISGVTWYLPTGAVSSSTVNYTHNSAVPYVVEIDITTQLGCNSKLKDTVVFLPTPQVSFSTFGVCQDNETQFFVDQTSLEIITDWSWDFGEPSSGDENFSSLQNPSHSYAGFGDFLATLIAEDINGCRDTTEQLVSILPTPQVDFTFTEVCQGQTVNFVNNSTIASPALIATTQWQLGAGATSTQFSPSRLYTVGGTFDITLTVTANNGCVQAQTQPMKVHALPEPDYTYTPSCAGLPTVFTDNSTVPDGDVAFVTWQFNANNPVNANPVSHTFTNPGEQQIRQTVISAFGCQFTAISNMVTNPALSAEFSTDPDLLLAGLPITFTNESVGADNVLWEIDAFYSGSDENPALTFDETYIDDTLTIVLIAYNDFGCSDTLVEEMRVYEAITDLAVTNIFTYIDPSGYETIGAELSNLGSSTITRADVFLRLADQLPMKGVYEGELRPGEKEVYVFETTIFPSTNLDAEEDQFICVNAQIVLPAGLVDERPENNERCLARTEDVPVLLTPYPNPASDVVNIRVILPAEEVLDIYVYDATGKVVTRLANQATLPSGATTYQLDVRELAVGTYTVYLVRENGDKKVVRFVVR